MNFKQVSQEISSTVAFFNLGEGKIIKVFDGDNNTYYKFIDGSLFYYNDLVHNWMEIEYFSMISEHFTKNNVKLYVVDEIPEKKWYENIPEHGVLCWVWDQNWDKNHNITTIIEYNPNSELPFIHSKDMERYHWTYAEPLTKDELLKFIENLG